MRRLIVITDEGCEVPFADMFDQVLRTDPFTISKDDVLLLEGSGADISPHLYGDVPGPHLNPPDVCRDGRELYFLKRFEAAGAHVLGICKGAQLACVFAGGNLIQHVTGHGVWQGHDIVTNEGEVFRTSSVHHQMMDPFDLSQEQYTILAHTPKPLSQTYLNGKGFDLLNGQSREFLQKFVEPEVVWFSKIRALAIQGHPEYMKKDDPFVSYSRQLVEGYLL